METYKILLIVLVSLVIGAAIYDGFLQLTDRLATKPFNPWAAPALWPVNPPPKYKESDRLGGAPPKDNWVRDGSKPKQQGSLHPYLIIVEGVKGVGVYHAVLNSWVVWVPQLGGFPKDQVDAWQKFPDYEKI